MPAIHFKLRWPDGQEMRCYSPSLVVKDHLTAGVRYPMPQFMRVVRVSLHTASERVRQKYGFACSMALDQLAAIEEVAQAYDDLAEVEVLGFED